MSRVWASAAAAHTSKVAQGAAMGQVVLTSRSCAFARPPAPAPVRLPTVAKWKVVKKKTKFRPRKVRSCAMARLRLNASGVQGLRLRCGTDVTLAVRTGQREREEACGVHDAPGAAAAASAVHCHKGAGSAWLCRLPLAIVVCCITKSVCFLCRRHDAWSGAPGWFQGLE